MFYVHGYTLDEVCVVCMCCLRVLCTVIYIQPSWQSYTGDAAPRVVNMHGVRVVYMHEEGGWIQHQSSLFLISLKQPQSPM